MEKLSRPRAAISALGILALYLFIPALFLLFGMMMASAQNPGSVPAGLNDLFAVLGYIAAIWLICRQYAKKGVPYSDAARFYPQSLPFRTGALAVLTGLCSGVALLALLQLLPISPQWMSSYNDAASAPFGDNGYMLGTVMILIFSPLSEELVFRGFIMRTLMRGMSGRISIVASSAAFAVLHMEPVWICYAFFMGLLLSWLALDFDNLAVPVLAHFGFNLMSLPFLKGIRAALNVGLCAVIFPVGAGMAVWLVLKMKTAEKIC